MREHGQAIYYHKTRRGLLGLSRILPLAFIGCAPTLNSPRQQDGDAALAIEVAQKGISLSTMMLFFSDLFYRPKEEQVMRVIESINIHNGYQTTLRSFEGKPQNQDTTNQMNRALNQVLLTIGANEMFKNCQRLTALRAHPLSPPQKLLWEEPMKRAPEQTIYGNYLKVISDPAASPDYRNARHPLWIKTIQTHYNIAQN